MNLEAGQEPGRSVFLDVVERHAPGAVRAWLQGALPASGVPFRKSDLLAVYAGAGRRFGGAPSVLGPADRDRLRERGVLVPEAWSLAELVRAALLLRALAEMEPGIHAAFVRDLFRTGDTGERTALLRSLDLLPSPGRFLSTAVEACRMDVLDVFEAIACENRYPALHFPDPSFNQLVIKALFLGVRVPRIHDWERRRNPDLVRMVGDYAAERRAAGRPVPEDIALFSARGSP